MAPQSPSSGTVAMSETAGPLHPAAPAGSEPDKADARVPKSANKLEAKLPGKPVDKELPPRGLLKYEDDHAPRASSRSPASAGTHAGKPHTVFIHKLFDMLEDPGLSRLIWWSPSGDSFCLYPGEEFSNVLAQYFKHGNIASFIRQLNMYGFHKVNDNFQTEDRVGSDAPYTKWEFRHSANQFRKGDVDSLSLIKRKSSKVMQSHKEIVSLKSLPPTSTQPVEEAPAQEDSMSHDSYHSSVYQHSWNQFSGPSTKSSSVSAADHARRPVYAAPMVSHPPYPVYSQPMVPRSPSSPSFSDPSQSPSYFLPQQSQPSSQPASRNPSTKTPVHSAESALNLKLIEINTVVNNLKASYHELSQRYDSLLLMHTRDQEDLLQLTEIVDRIVNKRDDDVVDRSKTKTPTDRTTTPSADCGMSPTNVKPQAAKCADLATFRGQLLRKVSNPAALQPQSQKAPPQNYHLDAPSTSKPANTHIVPQHYPLNPNYTLYNDSALRQMKQEETHHTLAQPTVNRHFSVLMDPLQPVPRVGSVSVRTPHEDRMASPGTPKDKDSATAVATAVATAANAANAANAAAASVAAGAAIGAPAPTAATGAPSEPYVQQYQPIPPPHVYYSHIMMQPNQIRASSLPVLSKPLPHKLGAAPQQRHSLTTLQHPGTPLYEDPLRGVSPRVATPSSMITSQPSEPLAAEDSQLAPIKNQLPSMQELNESIRHGPYYSDDEEKIKKRKLDG